MYPGLKDHTVTVKKASKAVLAALPEDGFALESDLKRQLKGVMNPQQVETALDDLHRGGAIEMQMIGRRRAWSVCH